VADERFSGKPSYEDLEAENAALKRRVAWLEEQLERALRRVEELERAGKRQAAPFGKEKPKADPKTPGRKPGDEYGKWSCRARPDHVDEVVEVPLPRRCPHCRGQVEEIKIDEQYQTELPPIQPITRLFRVHVGRCEGCRRTIRPGRHPLQTSDAVGAAGVQIGPNALALAMALNKGYGLSWGKVAAFFANTFGLKAAPSAFCRAAARAAARLEPTYGALVEAARNSWVIYADETGWRICASKAWLWTFVGLGFTVYRIARSRGADVVEGVLGRDYSGLICRDGWAAYDCLEAATHQSCVAHHFARAREILEIADRGAARFAHAVIRVLKAALDLRDRRGEISEHGFATVRGRIEARMDRLLQWSPTWEPNAKFRNHLETERPALFTFLHHPEVEAANWPAEQEIRPAVITRKVNGGGNRTHRGAHVQEVLVSIIRTAAQQGRDALRILASAFYAKEPLCIQLAPGPPR